MQQQTDILYFSYADENDNLRGSTLLPDTAYIGLAPNGTTTFEETGTGGMRTVRGWRMPQAPGMPWSRVRGRFTPTVDQPSMQFRYVSPNGIDDSQTLVGLDDLWVRRALEPDFMVSAGPAETR